MGIDEEGTLACLNTHRREFLDPKIVEHNGRVVKRTGDGVLIEFASAVDAMRCAIEIQRGMSERDESEEPDRRIDLRIGIHVGDILFEEGDIFGDGVNIAARLEGIAEPGGICISDDTFRQVRGKIDVDLTDDGDQSLKTSSGRCEFTELSLARRLPEKRRRRHHREDHPSPSCHSKI